MYPFKLEPHVAEIVWGGKRLVDEYGIKTEKANAAEAWVLSCLPSGKNIILNGEYKGKTLSEIYSKNKSVCGKNGKRFNDFPVLIKFIDARDNLSVQVHPTDEYCKKVGRGSGKTEAWYILGCDDDACLILGFKEKMSREEFETAIENNTLTEHLQKIKVKKGDFFFIDSGTLHAICKGVLLAEVQQSSDTTYRIYDYNRPGIDGKPRELHVKDALEVTKLEPYENRTAEPEEAKHFAAQGKMLLAKCELFTVFQTRVSKLHYSKADDSSFVSLLVLSGEGSLSCGETVLSLQKGESVFIPAACGKYELSGEMELLETRI